MIKLKKWLYAGFVFSCAIFQNRVISLSMTQWRDEFNNVALTDEAQARRMCAQMCARNPDLPRLKTIAVVGAYGQRWRNEFGRDQLAGAIDVLRREPSSRQIMVSAWHPGKDGLNAHSKALVPCPVDFTMQVLNDRLNVAVHMRSSDVAVGLPYDTMFYALLLDALACETKLNHGKLTMNLDHAHIYETHLHDMQTLPHITASTMELPGYSISRIMQNPDAYVRRVKTLAARAHQPASSLKFSAVAAPKL